MKEIYKGYIKNIKDTILKDFVLEKLDNILNWKMSKLGKKYAKYDSGTYLLLYFENNYIIIHKREKYFKELGDKSF